MRGFITQDQRYYETANGQVNATDKEVPLRPSEHHVWNEDKGWLGARGSDDFSINKLRFKLQEVGTIISIAVMGVSLYFGITSKMETTNVEIRSEMKLQSYQIQTVKDAQVSNTQTLHMELEDLKKRLDIHETRTFKKGTE